MNDFADLSPDERRALLNRLLRERTHQSREPQPLSHGQRSLWFLHQLAPESTAYHMAFAWRLHSKINVPALKNAFQTLVDRHAILRTTYRASDAEPGQIVHETGPVHFVHTDVGELNDEQLHDRLIASARRPFNLESGPIIRVDLFSRSVENHVQLVTMHHIASDMRSVEILMAELRILYDAERTGGDHGLATVRCQYADYARWQHSMLASERGEQHWEYWRRKLGGELPVLNLPTDRSRPRIQTYNGTAHLFDLDIDLVHKARALAKEEGATIYSTFLTAFQILLHRYTRQTEILVGSPSIGRSRPEFGNVMGYFVNPVIFRADLAGDPSFRELLKQTRKTVYDALDHQDYPFPLLVEKLKAARDPSRSPVADVFFVWDNIRHEENRVGVSSGNKNEFSMEWGELELESFSLTQVGSTSDLVLLIMEVGDRLSGTLSYNTDLFDAESTARMVRCFTNLLNDILSDPDRRISQFSLLAEEDRTELAERHRVEISTLDPAPTGDDTLHSAFETQAARHPGAVSVVCDDEELSYEELNRRANQLAHHLQALGVNSETLVGLAVDRSFDLVVGILGILKAGGAYLPLDPRYPDQRISFMLEDSQAQVLVTTENLSNVAGQGVEVVRLDADQNLIRRQPCDNPCVPMTPDCLAYVIYTSGSTGKPKGVMVTHRNVMRLFESTQQWFGFDETDVWSLFHSASFDFSVWELWGALLHGGKVVVVPWHVSRDPRAFLELLISHQVTVLNQTPSAFRQLMSADETLDQYPDLALRWVVFGGEALDLPSLKPWFERHGDRRPRLVNMYGITETTVHVTYREIDAADATDGTPSLIGTPLPDLSLRVLDDHGQLCPIGVPGELYVGGAGVARGYLGREQLTRERFVKSPVESDAGTTLYRTGDLVRRRNDGDIEYLGRVDQQVQLRGFRIELGEIEAALEALPPIERAVATVFDQAADDRRIVAYYTLAPDSPAQNSPTQDELRARLRRVLPDYMLPSSFIAIESIPLTENGKTDVRSLPPPSDEPDRPRDFVEPRNELEREVATIWSSVLGVSRVSVEDNFFDLGGHSLLATRIVARLNDAFDVSLPLVSFFESPTVAAVTQQIEARQLVSHSLSTEEAMADDEREEFEL